jgi:hypothetical protein
VARSRTLTAMISDVRQRTNQESSTFVTDAEVTEYLNQEIAELYARIVQAQGPEHYRSSASVPVVSGTALYALPADFFQLQALEATLGGITGRLRPFMQSEHALLANAQPYAWYSPIRYRVQANNLEILPATQTFNATLYYTPAPPRLVSGGDTFDGFAGYEVAAIYGACATVLAKEESDPGFYMAQRDRIYTQIQSVAAQRDANEPERVQDVTTQAWPFGGVF